VVYQQHRRHENIPHAFLRKADDILLIRVLEYDRLGLLFSHVVEKTKKRGTVPYTRAWVNWLAFGFLGIV
jgi:hypothetical protein